jgi:hypothetical protein
MDWPHQRRASVYGSAAALRSDFVPAVSPPALHFSRSPTTDRSQIIRIRGQNDEFVNRLSANMDFPITD